MKKILIKISGNLLFTDDGILQVDYLNALWDLTIKYFDKIFFCYGGGNYIKSQIRSFDSANDYLNEYEKTAIEIMLSKMDIQLSNWSNDKPLSSVNIDSIICKRGGSLCCIENNKFFNKSMLFNNCIFSEGAEHYFPSSDETATLLSQYISPDIFLFLTNVDGVYYPFPFTVGQRPLHKITIESRKNMFFEVYIPGVSNISQKIDWALLASTFSNQTIIANGNNFYNIQCILNGEPYVGTKIDGERRYENPFN